MTGKQVKEMFCNIPDEAFVRFSLQNQSGGGIDIPGIIALGSSGRESQFQISLPDGWFITSNDPMNNS